MMGALHRLVRRIRRLWHRQDVSDAWLRTARLEHARQEQAPPEAGGHWPEHDERAVARLHLIRREGYRFPWRKQ
jgi:hypothetical protein